MDHKHAIEAGTRAQGWRRSGWPDKRLELHTRPSACRGGIRVVFLLCFDEQNTSSFIRTAGGASLDYPECEGHSVVRPH